MNGWWKFHRQMFENPVVNKDSEHFYVWCWILSNAEFEERRVLFAGKERVIEKGQFITTSRRISEELKINKNKVDRILNNLKNAKQIDKQGSNQNTLITVINWEKYQSDDKQNDKRIINERETSEKQMINECETDDKPSYYIKNKRIEEKDKKEEKPKKNESTVYYPNDELLDSAFKEFLVMRNKIKKPIATKQALTRIMNRIEKLSGGDNDLAIKILNQSTDHCWQDVYELKGDDNNGRIRRNDTKDIRDPYAEEFERLLNE